MRALWIDSGNDPNWAKVNIFSHLFFDMFDPRINLAYLNDVRAKGYGVGLYSVSNWPQFVGKSGKQQAEIVHAQVTKVADAKTKIQFDVEEHDPDLVLSILRRWRELRPKQDTSWTFESFQGGWMSPEFVNEIVNVLKVRVVPQYYKGNMANLDEPDPVKMYEALLAEQVAQDIALKDLLSRGFPYALVTGFYDARTLPMNWDGFAFTQGRLP